MIEEEKKLIEKILTMSDEQFKEYAKSLPPHKLIQLYKLSTERLKESYTYVKECKKREEQSS